MHLRMLSRACVEYAAAAQVPTLITQWVARGYHPAALHVLAARLATCDEAFSDAVCGACVRELVRGGGSGDWWALLGCLLAIEGDGLCERRVRRSLLGAPGPEAAEGLLPAFERSQYSRPTERAPFDAAVRLLRLLRGAPAAARAVGGAAPAAPGGPRPAGWLHRFFARRLYVRGVCAHVVAVWASYASRVQFPCAPPMRRGEVAMRYANARAGTTRAT